MKLQIKRWLASYSFDKTASALEDQIKLYNGYSLPSPDRDYLVESLKKVNSMRDILLDENIKSVILTEDEYHLMNYYKED